MKKGVILSFGIVVGVAIGCAGTIYLMRNSYLINSADSDGINYILDGKSNAGVEGYDFSNGLLDDSSYINEVGSTDLFNSINGGKYIVYRESIADDDTQNYNELFAKFSNYHEGYLDSKTPLYYYNDTESNDVDFILKDGVTCATCINEDEGLFDTCPFNFLLIERVEGKLTITDGTNLATDKLLTLWGKEGFNQNDPFFKTEKIGISVPDDSWQTTTTYYPVG